MSGWARVAASTGVGGTMDWFVWGGPWIPASAPQALRNDEPFLEVSLPGQKFGRNCNSLRPWPEIR
jgi:hypothetical protein